MTWGMDQLVSSVNFSTGFLQIESVSARTQEEDKVKQEKMRM